MHIHNDFGMATALSLAAVEEGVAVVNTTFTGLGERAGNTPIEEVVFALELLYGIDTGIAKEKIFETSQRVEELSGLPIGITKPIVGYNAFTHESGIHTDGVIKNTLTYEPIQVESVGRKRRFVFGKHTGTRAVAARLEEHGIDATKDQLLDIANRIKVFTEEKPKEEIAAFIRQYRAWDADHKGVTPADFWRLVGEAGLDVPDKWKTEAAKAA